MDKTKEILNELVDNIRSLEDSLISEISNTRVETEMVLKQLAGYLNISAQNLTDVSNIVHQFDNTIKDFKTDIKKIDSIENQIFQFPQETYKIKEDINKNVNNHMDKVNNVLGGLISYLKKLATKTNDQNNKLDMLIRNVAENRKAIKSNQNNLVNIINNLIENKDLKDQKSIQLEETKIKANTKLKSDKLKFWLKIILALIGSGGFIYFIIDLIIKSTS